LEPTASGVLSVRRGRFLGSSVRLAAAVDLQRALRTGGVFLPSVGDRLTLPLGIRFQSFSELFRKSVERDEIGSADRTLHTAFSVLKHKEIPIP